MPHKEPRGVRTGPRSASADMGCGPSLIGLRHRFRLASECRAEDADGILVVSSAGRAGAPSLSSVKMSAVLSIQRRGNSPPAAPERAQPERSLRADNVRVERRGPPCSLIVNIIVIVLGPSCLPRELPGPTTNNPPSQATCGGTLRRGFQGNPERLPGPGHLEMPEGSKRRQLDASREDPYQN